MAKLPLPPDDIAPRDGALLWIDAMRSLGGLPPQSFKQPNARRSWKEFASRLSHGKPKTLQTLEDWLRLAMSEAPCAALVQSRCGWAFFEDPFQAEREGFFYGSDGAQIATFLLDCPNERIETLPSPMDFLKLDSDMEGVWFAGEGPGGALECLLRAWDQMSALGFVFSHEQQREWDELSEDADGFAPLGEQLWEIIPQLSAKRQAQELEQAAKTAPARAKAQGL